MKYKRLGEILVDAGAITEDELMAALEGKKETGERLGEYLVSQGIITEEQLVEVLQMQLGIDFVDLNSVRIDPELISLVPTGIAKQNKVVPVKMQQGKLYLAMEDPLNFMAIEEVKTATRKRVVPMIAYHNAVERAINILYGSIGANKAIMEMQEVTGPDTLEARAIEEEMDESSMAPTVKLVNSIIERAINERASDIHVEPLEDRVRVRIRVDDTLSSVLTIPKELQGVVISRLKIMADMNIAERRIPQDGRSEYYMRDGKKIDLRLSTLPTIFGEKVVIRLLNRDDAFLSWKTLGIRSEDYKKYERLIKNTSGMVLVVGPTGSGKTSTLYAMINELKSETINMISLEDPVEFKFEDVTQVEINDKTGLTFARALRSCLRQDPDIICIGEIRDRETAETAMRAAVTGHFVLSTIHTEDAVSALDRLRDLGVPEYLIAGSIRGIISQRLVRKICPNCKEAYQPDPLTLDLAGFDAQTPQTFYRGKGCYKCLEIGYRGRTGVFEIVGIGSEIRELISKGADSANLRRAFAKQKDYTTMLENGRKLVEDGVTTPEELVRKVMILE